MMMMDELKSEEVIGTFEESAFQLCRKDGHAGTTRLQLKLFDVLGYPCIPLLGTYAESYEPTLPVVLLQASYDRTRVPQSVVNAVGQNAVEDIWIQFHGEVPMQPCSHFTCDSMTHISLVTHTFFYPDVSLFAPDLSLSKVIEIGVFEPHNVVEVHQNIQKDELGSGVPFNQMGRRECSIHGPAFSPNNCQIDRAQGEHVDFHSFWLVATCGGKTVVSFHAVAANANSQEVFRLISASAGTLEELHAGFQAFPLLAATIRQAFPPK